MRVILNRNSLCLNLKIKVPQVIFFFGSPTDILLDDYVPSSLRNLVRMCYNLDTAYYEYPDSSVYRQRI